MIHTHIEFHKKSPNHGFSLKDRGYYIFDNMNNFRKQNFLEHGSNRSEKQ